jgi:four helix bundle protein
VPGRGAHLASPSAVGVKRVEDLIAWQLANALKLEVYRLIRQSQGASADLRFRDQLRESASSVGMNIGEGFYRYGAAEVARFLSIALASLGETKLWMRDGIDREYFDATACKAAFVLAKRCRVASLRLRESLAPFIKSRSSRGPKGP